MMGGVIFGTYFFRFFRCLAARLSCLETACDQKPAIRCFCQAMDGGNPTDSVDNLVGCGIDHKNFTFITHGHIDQRLTECRLHTQSRSEGAGQHSGA